MKLEKKRLNVERRISNFDGVGKGRRSVECRTPNVEYRMSKGGIQ